MVSNPAASHRRIVSRVFREQLQADADNFAACIFGEFGGFLPNVLDPFFLDNAKGFGLSRDEGHRRGERRLLFRVAALHDVPVEIKTGELRGFGLVRLGPLRIA